MMNTLASVLLSVTQIDDEIDKLQDIEMSDIMKFLHELANNALSFGLRCLVAILILVIGRMLIKKFHSFLNSIFQKKEVEKTVSGFLLNVIKTACYILLILIVIHFVGIEPTSIVALLASTGVGIGMALSGTLQNFAGGILILFTHPYRVGDLIEVLGQFGFVKEIRLFHTVMETFDNRVILIPNGSISTSIVNNYMGNDCRRIDWSIALCYGNDFEEAKACIVRILEEDERVLKNPPYRVFVEDFKNDRVILTVWAWAKGEDFLDVKQDIGVKFYKEHIQKGLKQTYPRMEVVMKEEKK